MAEILGLKHYQRQEPGRCRCWRDALSRIVYEMQVAAEETNARRSFTDEDDYAENGSSLGFGAYLVEEMAWLLDGIQGDMLATEFVKLTAEANGFLDAKEPNE